ncbi:hypothetical protein GUITHDRAFT_121170 [Guillardia theta CCMP2712]|uniref:Uncharacterized protein n=1 Tax=Guillardia theta (strain CCMP2712) TaxID=905079 RepID=L1I9R9_GUITC|nr:hypothetical protein GUITHDRAFT_121170 [Guillardia theta CCMP2712]EKX32649.1 hypothetical protein GUITHDRAFT_121170 [Guillardia theta CCMP2712]|eukprot:XP_005819629.1 hypothetical protein GUITHDRAFT_121170 [Guillardia theta CCMP2712]
MAIVWARKSLRAVGSGGSGGQELSGTGKGGDLAVAEGAGRGGVQEVGRGRGGGEGGEGEDVEDRQAYAEHAASNGARKVGKQRDQPEGSQGSMQASSPTHAAGQGSRSVRKLGRRDSREQASTDKPPATVRPMAIVWARKSLRAVGSGGSGGQELSGTGKGGDLAVAEGAGRGGVQEVGRGRGGGEGGEGEDVEDRQALASSLGVPRLHRMTLECHHCRFSSLFLDHMHELQAELQALRADLDGWTKDLRRRKQMELVIASLYEHVDREASDPTSSYSSAAQCRQLEVSAGQGGRNPPEERSSSIESFSLRRRLMKFLGSLHMHQVMEQRIQVEFDKLLQLNQQLDASLACRVEDSKTAARTVNSSSAEAEQGDLAVLNRQEEEEEEEDAEVEGEVKLGSPGSNPMAQVHVADLLLGEVVWMF